MGSVVSLDTTVFAYYFFWRAWLVARRRANGSLIIDLHRKAMSAGTFMTFTILFQRPFQSIVIAFRKVLLLAAPAVPASWGWVQWVMEGVAVTLLDHNVVLSLTTVAL